MIKHFIYICITIILFGCKKDMAPSPPQKPHAHIKYFGFTLIDTYWEDPTDAEIKTNYIDEIHHFCNVADILVLASEDDLTERIQVFSNLDVKAIVHLNELFFELVDTNSASGSNYDLRSDYKLRWEEFKTINQSVFDSSYIAAFYIGEEPTWNGIEFSELNTVSQLMKNEFPTIPLLLIEAFPALNALSVPPSVDWIGFDRYFIKNPNEHTDFQQDWQILQSKISSPSQKLMVIMDSHYIDWAHGDYGSIDITEMDEVADHYYALAQSDEKVIGILGYFWPSGFDFPKSIGARGMPDHVKAAYERIGAEITGK